MGHQFYNRETGELEIISDHEPVVYLSHTPGGFDLGEARVKAAADEDGRVTIAVRTSVGKQVTVTVSPKGRFISVKNTGIGLVSGVDA